MSYDLNIFPLEERLSNNAKSGEPIVDLKTGHITIKVGDKFFSSTRNAEAELDSLLKLKDSLYRDYLLVSSEIEDIILKLKYNKESYTNILAKLSEVRAKISYISQTCATLNEQYTHRYEAYNKYLFIDMDPFHLALKENVKKIIAIEMTISECRELRLHVEEIKEKNTRNINLIQTDLKNVRRR